MGHHCGPSCRTRSPNSLSKGCGWWFTRCSHASCARVQRKRSARAPQILRVVAARPEKEQPRLRCFSLDMRHKAAGLPPEAAATNKWQAPSPGTALECTSQSCKSCGGGAAVDPHSSEGQPPQRPPAITASRHLAPIPPARNLECAQPSWPLDGRCGSRETSVLYTSKAQRHSVSRHPSPHVAYGSRTQKHPAWQKRRFVVVGYKPHARPCST